MTKIIEFYHWAVFINYWHSYTKYFNSHFKAEWHCKETWFIRIGLDKRFFDRHNFWYDGNTLKSLTVFWVSFGYGYDYVAKPIDENLNDYLE
jgi:hypothetical protein